MVMNNIQINEEKPLFQLFFLKDDKEQNVEVKEVEKIDFEEVKKRLEHGQSVFVTRKRKQKLNTTLVAKRDAAELLYISHI